MVETQSKTAPAAKADPTPANPPLVVFVCANCARGGKSPNTAVRSRPCPPDFGWPAPVKTILIPCAGRLQPEHLLKAFEDGADGVYVAGCPADKCHNLMGSQRAAKRVGAIKKALAELGVEPERIEMYHLERGFHPRFCQGCPGDG